MQRRATKTPAPVARRKPQAFPDGLWPSDGVAFERTCTDCPRLAAFLAEAREEYPDYYCAPVAPFGDPNARLIIVGLAPGFHGANASGRPFTGDHAGLILYRTLHRFGFANKPESTARGDGLRLINCRITNSVKCVPPQNKPTPLEIRTCNKYIAAEFQQLPPNAVLLALGSIAHNATLRALELPPSELQIRACRRVCVARRSDAARFLSLQPLQHPNPATDRRDVRGRVRPREATAGIGEQRTADSGQ